MTLCSHISLFMCCSKTEVVTFTSSHWGPHSTSSSAMTMYCSSLAGLQYASDPSQEPWGGGRGYKYLSKHPPYEGDLSCPLEKNAHVPKPSRKIERRIWWTGWGRFVFGEVSVMNRASCWTRHSQKSVYTRLSLPARPWSWQFLSVLITSSMRGENAWYHLSHERHLCLPR